MRLATIPDIVFSSRVSAGPWNENWKVQLIGCGLGNFYGATQVAGGTARASAPSSACYSYTTVPNYGAPHDYQTNADTVKFAGCNMGAVGGSATYSACSWGDGLFTSTTGSTMAVFGGAMFGDVLVNPGSQVMFAQGSVCVGPSHAPCIDNYGAIRVEGPTGGLGVVYTPSYNGIQNEPGSTLWNEKNLWGTVGGYGVRSFTGSNMAFTSGDTPTLTGGYDTMIGGAIKPWGVIVDAGASVSGAQAWVYQ